MLKIFRGLALGLVVLVDSAYVTPTYASSTSVIITSVQPGTPSKAYDEYVLLYNPAPVAADVTGWCLTNKSDKEFACFGASNPGESFIIHPESYALVVSEYKSTTIPDEADYSLVYFGNSITSSSIVASSDTISLVDHNGEVVDSVHWGDSIDSSQVYGRLTQSEEDGGEYLTTGSEEDWAPTSPAPLPPVNAGVYIDPDHSEPSIEDATIGLSEILANPSGADAGKEYIEIHNYGSAYQTLSGYSLLVGKSLEKTVQLPDIDIAPGEYFVIQNDTYSFTLLNTNSRVALAYGSNIIDEIAYIGPTDDMSWSLIEGVWQYTNQMTPGLKNQPSVPSDIIKKSKESTLKPCASNQYRHPDTNRCRLINPSSSSSAPKPCASNQYRNPETGRCRLISSTLSGPKPCKENQERNPETNRCRNIKKMTSVDYGVLGATTETNQEEILHMWLLGAVAALGITTYAVWEWRKDIAKLWRKIVNKLARKQK